MRTLRDHRVSNLSKMKQLEMIAPGFEPRYFGSRGCTCNHYVILSLNPLVVQLLTCVVLFVTPWTATCQASLSFTISLNLLRLMSIELMMPSNHLILCCLLLLLPSIFPSIRVFSNELALRIRWPKCWGFSFSINPSNEYSGLISLGLTGLISLLSKGLSRVFPNTTVQKHKFFSAQPSLWSNSHTCA